MARTDDDDFMFLNEEQNEVEDIPEVLAANVREIRVNGKGQKVRGKDLEWIPRSSFSSNETFKESEIYKDLRAGFTLKRKGDSEAGFMETYICRYSRRMGYIRCPKVNEPCNTTHNLRNKVKDFLENPLLDDESWVLLSEIDDS